MANEPDLILTPAVCDHLPCFHMPQSLIVAVSRKNARRIVVSVACEKHEVERVVRVAELLEDECTDPFVVRLAVLPHSQVSIWRTLKGWLIVRDERTVTE